MCGIVGYVGEQQAADILVGALRRLEYRGYDSAGVAVWNQSSIEVRRSVGKLSELSKKLETDPVHGTVGIGHTRWATHGRPSEENAHPHRAGKVVLIHNGIIENFLELRSELEKRGRKMLSETDTEVISHLIDENVGKGMDLTAATRAAVKRLVGSFSIVVISESEPGKLVAAKTATPIVIGIGKGENVIASDIPAILDHTRDMLFLEDGEMAEVTRDGVKITDFDGKPHERAPRHVTWDPVTAQKGGYKHFLLKEIHEQPQALIDTIRGRIKLSTGDVILPELDAITAKLDKIQRVTMVACGTAWHSCLVGKFFVNELVGLPAETDYGSEYRYRGLPVDERDLMIVVSQSGETADTLGSLEEAKRRGATTLAVCNVVDSSIARKADAVLYTHAGPEISVASTKAFTTQLCGLFLLAVHLGRRRGRIDEAAGRELLAALRNLPPLVGEALECEPRIQAIAREYINAKNFLYLGRGANYPIALEGALKLKEISYIHAEGYPAGEMKHGPIALVSEELPVVVILPHDAVYAKTLSNLKEVESRGGRIITLTDQDSEDLRKLPGELLVLPRTHPLLTPIVQTIPLQLLAYYVAAERGTDVDQPRNLAKSVTVE